MSLNHERKLEAMFIIQCSKRMFICSLWLFFNVSVCGPRIYNSLFIRLEFIASLTFHCSDRLHADVGVISNNKLPSKIDFISVVVSAGCSFGLSDRQTILSYSDWKHISITYSYCMCLGKNIKKISGRIWIKVFSNRTSAQSWNDQTHNIFSSKCKCQNSLLRLIQ